MSSDRTDRLKDRLLRQGRPSLIPRPMADRPEVSSLYARLRPFAEAMYLVIASDGVLDEAERGAIRGALRSLTEGELGTTAMESMFQEFDAGLAAHGLEVRLDQIAASLWGDREDAELAVSLGLAAAAASGVRTPEECDVIRGLAERLRISSARLRELK